MCISLNSHIQGKQWEGRLASKRKGKGEMPTPSPAIFPTVQCGHVLSLPSPQARVLLGFEGDRGDSFGMNCYRCAITITFAHFITEMVGSGVVKRSKGNCMMLLPQFRQVSSLPYTNGQDEEWMDNKLSCRFPLEDRSHSEYELLESR